MIQKTIILILTLLVSFIISTASVYASYGTETTTPKSNQPQEEVKHETVNAGFEDISLANIAGFLATGGAIVFVLSQFTARKGW